MMCDSPSKVTRHTFVKLKCVIYCLSLLESCCSSVCSRVMQQLQGECMLMLLTHTYAASYLRLLIVNTLFAATTAATAAAAGANNWILAYLQTSRCSDAS
jgi:hypothetical protein